MLVELVVLRVVLAVLGALVVLVVLVVLEVLVVPVVLVVLDLAADVEMAPESVAQAAAAVEQSRVASLRHGAAAERSVDDVPMCDEADAGASESAGGGSAAPA